MFEIVRGCALPFDTEKLQVCGAPFCKVPNVNPFDPAAVQGDAGVTVAAG
jgi:hypothetical protein